MRSLVVVMVLAGTASAEPAPGPSAKELVDWVDAKLAAVTSLEMEMVTTSPQTSSGQLFETRTRTDLSLFVREGDRVRSRYEMTGVTTYTCKVPGCKRPKPEPPSKLISITNGDETLSYLGGGTAQRSKAKQEDHRLGLASKLRGATKVSRVDADGNYGLETTSPDGIVMTFFVSPSTALPVKSSVRSKGGETWTTVVKRVEVNKKISADRFTLPPNITIEDVEVKKK